MAGGRDRRARLKPTAVGGRRRPEARVRGIVLPIPGRDSEILKYYRGLSGKSLTLTHRSEVYRFRADQAGRKSASFWRVLGVSDLPLPMPKADEPNDKALQSLDARLDAFEARKAAEKPHGATSERATQDGYRLLADLIGGVLVGVGFGWLLDHYVHTSPWGMVGGLLIGLGIAIFAIVRKAMKLSAQASAPSPQGNADEDTGGGSTAPKQKRD